MAIAVADKNEIFAERVRELETTAVSLRLMGDNVDEAAAKLRRGVRDRDPTQELFVGFIREYRYTSGRKGEMPSHRFYLECGRGVWLYARVASAAFEPVMVDAAMDLEPSSLNGMMLVMKPNRSNNTLDPVEIVEPLPLGDRFGNFLYDGAPVSSPDGPGNITMCDRMNERFLVNLVESGTEDYYSQGDVARRF